MRERTDPRQAARQPAAPPVADDYDRRPGHRSLALCGGQRIARLRRMREAVHGETPVTTVAQYLKRALEAPARGIDESGFACHRARPPPGGARACSGMRRCA